MTALRVLLIAEESAGVRTMKALLADDCEIAGVIADPEAAGASVWHAAGEASLPRWPAPDMAQAVAAIGDAGGIDLLFNVHSLRLLPPDVLALPRIGGFNLHPGPLPEYAGLDVVSWAIYNMEAEHAVTLHWLAERVDAGPVAHEARFALEPRDTAFTVYANCVRQGVPLIRRVVGQARAGEQIPRREQNAAARRYYRRGAPRAGWIDWHEPAERVAAFTRACDYGPFPSPWGRPRALHEGEELEIPSCTIVAGPASGSDVRPGTVLSSAGDEVIVATGAGAVRFGTVAVRGTRVPAHTVLSEGSRLESGSASAPLVGDRR